MQIDGMNESELLSRKESLESYFDACRRIQQGINTKESVQYRKVCDRLENEFGHVIERWQ